MTDHLRVVDKDDNLVWTKPLPDDSFTVSNSRPVLVNGQPIVGTSHPAIIAINLEAREVDRFHNVAVDARWWDLSGDRSLLVVGEGTLKTTVINVQTGDIQWSEGSGLTPYPTFTNGSAITAVSSGNNIQLRSYEGRSGNVEWRTGIPGEEISYTATVGKRVLAVSRITSGSTGTSFVTLADHSTGDIHSQTEVDTMVNRSGTVFNETGYLSGRNGNVYSVNPNGNLRTIARVNHSLTSPPAVSSDMIVVGDEEGGVQAFPHD